MELQITPATLADHDELYPFYLATIAVDNPLVPLFSRRSFDCVITHPFPDVRIERHVVRQDGRIVGVLWVELPLQENTDRMFLNIMVDHRRRREGLGRAIHAYAESFARSLNRTILGMTTRAEIEGCPKPDPAGTEFAKSLGYEPALPEVARQLDVSALDHAALDGMLAKAWEKASGYRIVSWRGVPPDDLIDDVAYLDGRLISDAPMGELELEPENITAQRVRAREEMIAVRGRETVHTGAVHEESGRLAAWTTICVDPEAGGEHTMQYITLVDPDHRGHRLGTIVKIENLRRALAYAPAISRITTWNAAANSYMIAINEAMGFRPAWGQVEWQMSLS
jgi:GNAT superfamily N-acetyltransferase